MANAQKGEVTFEANGKTYVLRFSTNALCDLEDRCKRGFFDIMQEMQAWSPPLGPDNKALPETEKQTQARMKLMRLNLVRDVFWAGLREHQDISVNEAGSLITAIGGLLPTMAIIANALAVAFPEKEDGAKNPQ